MKKFTCYIVDDEPLAIDVLETYVNRVAENALIGFTTDPVKALVEIKNLQPDLLFLDIEMPGLDGLELIRMLKYPPAVIITTAYRDYAVEGFELNVLDYLVKPIAFGRFLQALDKYSDQRLHFENDLHHEVLTVTANRKQVRINPEHIFFIEGVKDYVKIRLETEEVLTKRTLTEIQHQLPEGQFIRVHKSFIVSKARITAYSATDVEVGKHTLPVGRTYRAAFFRHLQQG